MMTPFSFMSCNFCGFIKEPVALELIGAVFFVYYYPFSGDKSNRYQHQKNPRTHPNLHNI